MMTTIQMEGEEKQFPVKNFCNQSRETATHLWIIPVLIPDATKSFIRQSIHTFYHYSISRGKWNFIPSCHPETGNHW